MKRNKTVTEINKDQHKLWHAFVPNWGVSYETIKDDNQITTIYRCHWRDWQKVIRILWSDL